MEANSSTELIFFVNGKKIVEKNVDPEWTLLYYLRNKLRLCGTKLGCAEGGCGACTVMVSKFDRKSDRITHLAVNACLAPVCSMHGSAVTTIEGIGSTKTKLHPSQERIAKSHGSQCGFCTPGIVMSMYTLLRSRPKPSMDDLQVAFQGNLCRCTGYRPILEGYKTFTEDWQTRAPCPMGANCCKMVNGTKETEAEEEVLFDSSNFIPYDPSQEPIFPPELKLNSTLDQQNLKFKGKEVLWYRPTSLALLLEMKQKHPDSKIVVGNTEIGVETKMKNMRYPILIQPGMVEELMVCGPARNGIKIGAGTTLQQLEDVLNREIERQPHHKTRVFRSVVNMLNWFAGKQIRNVASVAGNIMTGSPISDLNPIFVASGVVLELQSKTEGKRMVSMKEGFFTSYRKNIVKPEEVLVSIEIPYTDQDRYFCSYKQARRRDDDIAIVNAAFDIRFKKQTHEVEKASFAFGGMAPTTVKAPKTEELLIGRRWDRETLELAYSHLIKDLPLTPDAPGGMIRYRRSLTLSFFFKAFLDISKQIGTDCADPRDLSALSEFHPQFPSSSQYFEVNPEKSVISDTVGCPIVHASALKQASGEAVYCDDLPFFENELYMCLVLSTRPHATIIEIDPQEALSTPGVEAFFSAKDLKESQNHAGPVFHDEEVFVSKTVTSQGQVLGAIIAGDCLTAQKAAKKVKVVYQDLKPVVLSMDEAIEQRSFFPGSPKVLETGDVDSVFEKAKNVLEGHCRTGGQEHFYLETQCVIARPKGEDNEMELFCSTQHPSEVTKLVAAVLEVPQNRVVTRVKRIGGGFGGKESRANLVAIPAAIAAQRLERPIRCMLDRDEDMLISGGRHPFYIKYKVAFDDQGKILACEYWIYNNGGYSRDLSDAVLERALYHCENAYKIPHLRATGYVCKTNLPSNTAFRGFGGPQGMFAAESIIHDIADFLNKPTLQLMQLNLYKEGDSTHYNQVLEHCTLERCWEQVLHSSSYEERLEQIQQYNRENRWKKRGISVIPTKFGIAFSVPFLNQAGALVHVYIDGSVLISHGGTEMGQGLHTKMIQIASKVLEIPVEKIYISETATDKVPNTSATAASTGSDLNGMAVMRACEMIKERLEPIKKKNPDYTWEKLIQEAYFERISLSATGFYATPGIGYNWETKEGVPFNYFTYGVACSEVEIDCLTGDHRVLRTDIVMDLGESLNPAIDIGQVEGAFMQGYGLFTLEETVFLSNGAVFTRGPGAYKIPGFADIPTQFNVALLKGAPNPRAVYSSKAVGEPPLFLASSVFFAIKNAIKAARKDAGFSESFSLEAPATSARIRMACQDHLTEKFEESKIGSFIPWNVVP